MWRWIKGKVIKKYISIIVCGVINKKEIYIYIYTLQDEIFGADPTKLTKEMQNGKVRYVCIILNNVC